MRVRMESLLVILDRYDKVMVIGSTGLLSRWGYCSVVMSKLWGVFEGLKLTEEIGLRRIVINLDSIEMVVAIEKGSTRNGEDVGITKRIRNLMDMHDVVKVEHAYRESNKCADALV